LEERIPNAELFLLIRKIRKNPASIRSLVEETGYQRSWLEFVEGFFDAEGCVKIIREEGRRTPKACLDVCNTDLGILGILWRATYRTMGIQFKISRDPATQGRKATFHLRIYQKNEVKRFLALIATTKLSPEKGLLVENWFRKNTREGKPYRTFPSLASTSDQFTTFHQASTYLARSFR
jgi:intein-encoded DNA endonuclease-like protein